MITRLAVAAACMHLSLISTAWSEDAVPFEQVIGKRDEMGSLKIELDPVDEVLVFSGGTFVLWGSNLDIKAARVRIEADTAILAFPSGSVASNLPQSTEGKTGEDGAIGAPGTAGMAAGRFTLDFGGIEGPGRLMVHNDGADGLIGGQGGNGGSGQLGKNGENAQCFCEPAGARPIPSFKSGEVTTKNPDVLKNYEIFLQLQESQKLAEAFRQKQSQMHQVQTQNQSRTNAQRQAQADTQVQAEADVAAAVARELADRLPLGFSPQGLRCDRTKGGSGGGRGGPGGNGGVGGIGGTGGAGGEVLYSESFQQLVHSGQITLTASGGRPGPGGSGGALGKGGRGGRGGLEFCRSSKTHANGPSGADGVPGETGDDGEAGPSGVCGLIGQQPSECQSGFMAYHPE